MARIAKKTKRYPSDLTDEEWERIAPLMPKPELTLKPDHLSGRQAIAPVRPAKAKKDLSHNFQRD